MLADKGYPSKANRAWLREHDIAATILERDDQIAHRRKRPGRPIDFGRKQHERYKGRNVVERCFNKLKQWRGIATRSDKTTRKYHSALCLAATLQWIERCGPVTTVEGMTPARVTTNPAEIDFDVVHRWLSDDAFWAIGRSRETVDRAARGSLNFGVLDADETLIGYARVVTDHATFAWVCDVYVDPAARGLGIGLLLAESVVAALRPKELKRVLLSTLDAHGLYEKVGFESLPHPEKLMQLSHG